MEECPTSYGADNLKRADKIFSVSAEQGQRAVCGLLYANQSTCLSFWPESGLLNWGHSVLKLGMLSLFSYYVWASLFCLITKTWWCQKSDQLSRDWKSGFRHVYFLWCVQFHWRNMVWIGSSGDASRQIQSFAEDLKHQNHFTPMDYLCNTFPR